MLRKHSHDDIQSNLIKYGRALFSQKGFKKTQIADITGKADIAAGTFYNYFKSKEELFLYIFTQENNALKERIMDKVNLNGEPVDVAKQIFYYFIEGMQSSNILQEFFNQSTFIKIEQKTKFSQDEYEIAYDLFIPLIEKWQKEGKIQQKEPRFIMAFFNALFYVFLHQEDIGDEFFPELMDLFIRYIMEGLKAD